MHKNTASLEFWSEELEYSKLPDERFRSNLVKMCHSLQEKPEHSFSSACGEVVRKSAHRLFSKEESIDIQLGHRHKTLERCKNHNRILVIEDTADLNYSSHKSTKGLGGLGGKNTKGLNIHSAMVLTTEAEPLGLIGQYIWAPRASGRKKKNHNYSIQEKESFKWIRTKKPMMAEAYRSKNKKSRSVKRFRLSGLRLQDFKPAFCGGRQAATIDLFFF